MIKKAVLVMILIFFTACSSTIVLKKEKAETPPLKIEKGEYNLNLYKIEYGKNLEEKQKFMEEFKLFLQKVIVYNEMVETKKRYSILLNEDFFKDLESLKTEGIFEEENILLKTSSSLDDEDKKRLGKITRKKTKDLIVQDILDIQIEYLFFIAKKMDDFEKDKVYTELDKEKIVNIIKKDRKKIKDLLDKVDIDFVMEIDKPYEKKKEDGFRYYYEKEIKLNTETGVFSKLKDYSYPLYFKNLKAEDIEILFNKESDFKKEVLIISQDSYKGYIHFNSNFVFFEAGKESINEYEDYKIEITVDEIKLDDLIEKEEINIIRDISGG